ncbi:MAG: 50S ribosomal protein L3 [Candidatus Dormibacteria bacterium]
MSRGILARKVGMTQLFTERGTIVPVTVLDASGCRVVQRKTTVKEGYEAVQIGFGERESRKTNKPLAGHFRRAGVKPLRHLVELRDAGEPEVGSSLEVGLFSPGDVVDVTGTSQGKGFSGTHKRHNFALGPKTHGSMNYRAPGSIGSVDAARVFKGVKLPGHMGAVRRTVRGLEVVRVDAERRLLLIKGSVPGHRNAVVLVRDADKRATF